jgi:Holliday junction resolvase RusA-like endonuclease
VRSTLDALTTAGTIEDDARVVEIVARKHYSKSSRGARIGISAAAASDCRCHRHQPGVPA